MNAEAEFLRYSAEKLEQYCERIETCVGKLTPEQVWARGSEAENSAGNLLLHLNGNVQQWILTGVGSEPDKRNRDAEFAARGGTPAEEMLRALRETVERANALIRSLPEARLTERVTIQGHNITVLEAIYHVVEHFSGHTGQIIFITKRFTGQGLGFYNYLNQPGAASGRVP
jgi:uncharacterized damage-inducible protein DinB